MTDPVNELIWLGEWNSLYERMCDLRNTCFGHGVFFKQKRYFVNWEKTLSETSVEKELYFQWNVIHHSDILPLHIIYHQRHTLRHFRKFWINKIFFTHVITLFIFCFQDNIRKACKCRYFAPALFSIYCNIIFTEFTLVVKLYHLALYLWSIFSGGPAISFVHDHLIGHEGKAFVLSELLF